VARFKITLEYEGTRYSGWQVQQNARTVQGEILGAFGEVFGTRDLEFMGSGRTDAGVHALAQIAHLEVKTMLAPEIIRMKTNDLLPADINLIEVEKANPRFHARHDAAARRYLYQISRRRSAFGKKYVWWVKDMLSVAAMQKAASAITGLRDLRALTADDPEEKSTKVAIEEILIAESGDLILVSVTGSHFLWKLVRRMVGVLVEAGRGSLPPGGMAELLSGDTSYAAKHTAPPSGLFLERVYYPGQHRLSGVQPVFPVARKHELAAPSPSPSRAHGRQ
jgi:tRNA pseudouridine38-40 synthase